MDRNTFIGFALIGLVLMVWMWMTAPPPPQRTAVPDSTSAQVKTPLDTVQAEKRQETAAAPADTLGRFFAGRASMDEKRVVIETDEIRATISSRGGAIRSWQLKKFNTWNNFPVDLVYDTTGAFNLLFTTADGKVIDTRSVHYDIPYENYQVVTAGGTDTLSLQMVLPVNERSRIVKTFKFVNGSYSFDCQYRFENMGSVIANYEYQAVWEGGLRYAERNSVDESGSATSFAFAGGELTEANASSVGDSVKQNISGKVNWIAARTKYFCLAIIARSDNQGAFLEGHAYPQPDHGVQELYSVGMKMPFVGRDVETANFTVYLGPVDYQMLKGYNAELEHIMNLGAAWIIRPIAQYMIMPLFQAIHYVIANWGLVIIVFALIMKVVLYPLSKSSMKSMKKMQQLQPMMTEIREKYKDDPQKMNAAVMRLYKEYGINPAGGCLPLLLQLPILYALWAVFQSTIQLRHAPFFGWINDLSVPDVIAHLPFAIPLFNITELSGLALLMGITMFVQQKMATPDPRQKAMVWMMPIMMTLLFNSFPSGLNLYYFVFNLLQIGQQLWMNKQGDDEPLRKVEEKKGRPKGIINYIAKELPKMNRK